GVAARFDVRLAGEVRDPDADAFAGDPALAHRPLEIGEGGQVAVQAGAPDAAGELPANPAGRLGGCGVAGFDVEAVGVVAGGDRDGEVMVVRVGGRELGVGAVAAVDVAGDRLPRGGRDAAEARDGDAVEHSDRHATTTPFHPAL